MRMRRWLIIVSGLSALLLAGVALSYHLRFRASLPILVGEVALPGLDNEVSIVRDAMGVPTLRARSERDLVAASGWLHAQDRFFQMDLLRRAAAGELSALFGERMLEADRNARLYQFRKRAQAILARADEAERALLQTYADGVNCGLAALGAAPFEHVALGLEPEPWRPEDTVLVVMALFLQSEGSDLRRESSYATLYATLPTPFAEFLTRGGSDYETPLAGEALAVPTIPGPEVFRVDHAAGGANEHQAEPAPNPGSNAWAVAGSRSAHGGALLANDMHLQLALPNIWYRARTEREENGRVFTLTGVMLPGVPGIIVGSNGKVAWGFTAARIDSLDLVTIETTDGKTYLGPDGPTAFTVETETIAINGGASETLEIRKTVWGPVVDQDWRARPLSLLWTALEEHAFNLAHLGLDRVENVGEALDLANRIAMPTQNFLCADITGAIGWTLIGLVPARRGYDGLVPVPHSDPKHSWEGLLAPAAMPRLIGHEQGFLWSANHRQLGGEQAALLGDGGFDVAARARQIHDALAGNDHVSEADMLALQLETRAPFYDRWRALLLETLSAKDHATRPRWSEMREAVADPASQGAVVDSAGFRLVRSFRLDVAEILFGALTSKCAEVDADFDFFQNNQYESALWELVEHRPAHLLPAAYPSWEALLAAAVDKTLTWFPTSDGPLSSQTWGRRNTFAIQHPLGSLPLLGAWLNTPTASMPGDTHVPNYQNQAYGPSMRMVVSPGQEAQGIFHMPGGNSGHPYSPYYLAGHEDWLRGKPSPFLPGPEQHRLKLVPDRGN